MAMMDFVASTFLTRKNTIADFQEQLGTNDADIGAQISKNPKMLKRQCLVASILTFCTAVRYDVKLFQMRIESI